MRISIHADGVPTEQVREIAVALHRVGLTGELKVGCDGPHHWKVETPKLTPGQHAQVACHLIKFQGEPVADVLDTLR